MTAADRSRVAVQSAGAAESLVSHVTRQVDGLGIGIDAAFAAVGVLRDRWVAGATADLYVTSARLMQEMLSSGELEADEVADLGWVQTGLAVRDGDPIPDCTNPDAVLAALQGAGAVFTPDPVRSTAGAHFATVLDRAGVVPLPDGVLHVHPNGATAMAALAAYAGTGPAIGSTQMTEILQVEGVTPVGALPTPFDLATLYRCALVAPAGSATEAREVFDLLTGPSTAGLRAELGFVELPDGAP